MLGFFCFGNFEARNGKVSRFNMGETDTGYGPLMVRKLI